MFCGWLNGRGRRTDTRVERSSGSSDTLSEQFGQADGVVGGHREGELPIDLEQSAVPHLAQASHRLGPAEGLLDPFADALRDRIAGFAGGAVVDRRAPAVGVLRDLEVNGCCACGICPCTHRNTLEMRPAAQTARSYHPSRAVRHSRRGGSLSGRAARGSPTRGDPSPGSSAATLSTAASASADQPRGGPAPWTTSSGREGGRR